MVEVPIKHITDQTHPKLSGPNDSIIFQQPRNLPEVFWGLTGFPNFKPTFRGGRKQKKRALLIGRKGKIPNPPLCDHNSRIQGL